ncbi:hypothetical protein [Arthrobacter sp. H5]|uniref:hypothetical protein n=1 Tax=Arthrobacter sp. H5 TaxID=1267973 RepID=UPI0004B544F0|nr:hypothetical protein [Arthrobacter sp. H5]
MDGIGPIAGTWTYLYRTTAANAESATTAATTYADRSPPIQDIQGGEDGRDGWIRKRLPRTDSARCGLLETGCELEVDDSANDRAHRNQNAQNNSR